MTKRTLRSDIAEVRLGIGKGIEYARNRKGKIIAAPIAGAMVVTSVFGVNKYVGGLEQAEQALSRQALEKATQAYDGSLLIQPGANLRTSPRVNDSELAGNSNGKVQNGQVLVVRNPIVGPDGWLGFVAPDIDRKSINTLGELAADTQWVNYRELNNQDVATLVPSQGASVEATQKITVLDKGQVLGPDNRPIGESHILDMSDARAVREMLAYTGVPGVDKPVNPSMVP